MDCLGFFIVLGIIIWAVRGKGQKKNQQVKTNQPRPNQTRTMPNQPRPNQPRTMPNQSRPNQNRNIPNQAKTIQSSGQGYQIKERKMSSDELRSHAQEKYVAQVKVQKQEENHNLMREVEDLMVKGYDAKLSFDRDFVAEGVELLNRIQM